MATISSDAGRGQWGSKLGFVLAAAGSAVGLGNIWGFPSEVAENGGAAFLIVYLACCFLVGFPVMVAELTIGRRAQKNPVGAFKALHPNSIFGLIGGWGVLCGVMILAFYTVIAGWTLSFVFSELFHFFGNESLAAWFGNTGDGVSNTLFSAIFMLGTISIVTGGISGGIEKATKTLMPILIGVLLIMIVYVLTLDGSSTGLAAYLKPDFSQLSGNLIFQAMGQAFFSLSLGMGALITYGSYLDKKQNIPEAAAYVTLADVGIAFLAGLLIMPAMYVAQAGGIEILDENGALIASTTLVFNVLPNLFHTMGSVGGLIFGVTFFLLLSMAALTSTISLLEVPVSYAIDEHGMARKTAAWLVGGGILVIAAIISFNLGLIDWFVTIFNNIGLPLGGVMICLFLAYVWKTRNALDEIYGTEQPDTTFARVWPVFVGIICPILIGWVLITSLWQFITGFLG